MKARTSPGTMPSIASPAGSILQAFSAHGILMARRSHRAQKRTLHSSHMSPEVLGKLYTLRPLLPEFDVAISRSGNQELCLTGHHRMCDGVSVHVAALIHLC